MSEINTKVGEEARDLIETFEQACYEDDHRTQGSKVNLRAMTSSTISQVLKPPPHRQRSRWRGW